MWKVRCRAPAAPEVQGPGELGRARLLGRRTGTALRWALSSWGWCDDWKGMWASGVGLFKINTPRERCLVEFPKAGGAQGLSMALTEPKTSEELVSLLGIYSSGCKRLLNKSEVRLIHRFLLLQLSWEEEGHGSCIPGPLFNQENNCSFWDI